MLGTTFVSSKPRRGREPFHSKPSPNLRIGIYDSGLTHMEEKDNNLEQSMQCHL